MFNVLTSMRCWSEESLRKPWEYHVTYEMAPDTFESSASIAAHPGLKASITCNDNGDAAALDVVYDAPSTPMAIPIGSYGSVNIHAVQRLGSRLYLKKDAIPTKAIVEARKTFTFHEFVDWKYEFVLRYREPYHKPKTSRRIRPQNRYFIAIPRSVSLAFLARASYP
jgi:hypothetical protein